MMRILLLAALTINLAGCATFTKPTEHKFDKSVQIGKAYDDTWARVIQFFSSKNIAIKTIEKNSGIIVSEPFTINLLADNDRFDCGSYSSDVLGNKLMGKSNFNVFVEKVDSKKSKVTVNANAEINFDPNFGPMVTTKYNCYSKGSFEKMLFEFLK